MTGPHDNGGFTDPTPAGRAAQLVAALVAHGHTAGVYEGRAVILLHGRVWSVVGGNPESPSLLRKSNGPAVDAIAWVRP